MEEGVIMPTFQSDKYPVLHIKLPNGTHVRFLNGTVEVSEEAAEELRKHQWYDGMFYEQRRVTWAVDALKGGEAKEEKPSEEQQELSLEEEEELKHVVK